MNLNYLLTFTECQTPNPKAYQRYESAPNDVWSLGVILVNLTCGRNPWKRASREDSTFRAYMENPRFLRTILPISEELDSILSSIFQIDPRKRITIRELKAQVQACPRFTASKTVPASLPSPPLTPVEYARDAYFANPCYQLPAAPVAAPQYCPPRYSTPPASPCSSDSGDEAVYMTPPTSFAPVNNPPAFKLPPCGPRYVSPPPASSCWYNPFFQAVNIVKHVPFHHAPVYVH